jgi:signal peptide peptidase SppA
MNKPSEKPQILQRIPLSPFWLVRHEALITSLAGLQEVDLSAYWETETEVESKPYEVVDGVAIVPITGMLTRDGGWWTRYLGGTAVAHTRLMLMEAVNDAQVHTILLYVYSPGGEVYGISDFAGSVREANKTKKVWAYIADEGCSAAYWVASQAHRIVCNETALVGSIGVMSVVEDWSQAYRKQGVKVEVIKSGPYKGAGERGVPVTDDEKAERQRLVDAMADQFFDAVSEGRNLDEDALDAVTTGQVWIGEEAKALGLVDEINTLEGCLAKIQSKTASNDVRRMYGANTQPALTGKKENTMFRELYSKIAASFAKLGRNHLAAAALGADENNADDLVNRLNAQIESEVQTAVSANPMLAALNAAEIKTPQALQELLLSAKDGRDYSAAVTQEMEAAAVRLFGNKPGTEEGAKSYVAAYRHLPISERKKVTEQWNADADRLFGNTPTQPAQRQTAPTALQTAARDAEGGQKEVLSAEERNTVRAAVGGKPINNGGGK